ncbi:hypothetical protein OC844_005180, partial [Tilletia horrida]
MPARLQQNGTTTVAAFSRVAPTSGSTSSPPAPHLVAQLLPSPALLQDGHARTQGQEDDDDDDNALYLSAALWDRIAPPHKQARHRSTTDELRIAVTITPLVSPASTARRTRLRPSTALPTIIAWARPRASTPAATTSDEQQQQQQQLSITYPPSLAQHLPLHAQHASIETFFPPLPLSAVYLAALDAPSFDYANTQQGSLLHAKLAGRILRQGERISFADSSTRFRVVMTEPLLQGFVR